MFMTSIIKKKAMKEPWAMWNCFLLREIKALETWNHNYRNFSFGSKVMKSFFCLCNMLQCPNRDYSSDVFYELLLTPTTRNVFWYFLSLPYQRTRNSLTTTSTTLHSLIKDSYAKTLIDILNDSCWFHAILILQVDTALVKEEEEESLHSTWTSYQATRSMKGKRKVLWREPCHFYRNVSLLLFSL